MRTRLLLGLALASSLGTLHCKGGEVGGDSSTSSSAEASGSGGASTVASSTTAATSSSSGQAGSGGAGGQPLDPCLNRTICEDFESTAIGQAPGAPFELHVSHGTVAVDDTRAVSGKHSLKVSIEATTPNDTYRQAMLAVTGAPLIPLPSDTVYGRFMIWTDRIPDQTVHWTIAHGDGPQAMLSATYNYGGMGGLMANYYEDTAPLVTDCWQTKNQMFPTNAWTCVGFEFDGTNDEMRFWLDGVEVPELHVIGLQKNDMTCTNQGVNGQWLAPDFQNISVGWESYQHDAIGAHDAWIDDVILDDTPIPCP